MSGFMQRMRLGQQRRAFNMRRRSALYADMARFMKAGIPPFRALEKIQEQAAKRRGSRNLAIMYRRMMAKMSAGERTLADALAPEIPGGEAVMLVGAAAAGPVALARAFEEVSALLNRKMSSMEKLRQALIGGGASVLAIIGLTTMMMTVVVPQLQASASPEMLAQMGFAAKYFAFGHAFLTGGPFVGVLVVLLTVWAFWSLPRWHKKRPFWNRGWFDAHLMPWTFYLRTQATFFLATVASMMRAGVPMRDALTDMQKYSQPWLRSHIRSMLRGLSAGRAEVEVLAGSFLPADVSERLAIYALIPDFVAVMSELANDNFRIYEEKIGILARVMRLLTMILLALFIASTLFAIFDFSNALRASVHGAGM